MADDPVYVAGPLLSVLCELAADAEPTPISVALATRRAVDLEPSAAAGVPLGTLHDDTPVFAEFYFPGAGGAINRVFGMDLGRPVGGTAGRFVSHPAGEPTLTRRDDLAPRVFVAVPPWTTADVRVFDRLGTRHELRAVAASVPDEPFEAEPIG